MESKDYNIVSCGYISSIIFTSKW